jgi:hypothetical protein
MAHLPASPTARRKEEEARRLERLRDMERKLDTFHRGGVAKAASSTPLPQTPSRSPEEEALQNLARNLGDGSWTLPAFATINRAMDDEGEIATGFTVEGFFFPLKLAYDLNIVALDGRVDVYRLGPILHTLKGGSPLTQPARRPRL